MRSLVRILLLAVGLVSSLSVAKSYGQAAAYYNFRKPLHSLSVFLTSVHVDTVGGVFYTVGPCWDSVNIIRPGLAYNPLGVRFTKWRLSDGQKLLDTVAQQGILDTTSGNTRNYMIVSNNSNNLVRLPNRDFLTIITTVDTGGVYRIGLLCLDSTGRKRWLKEYDKPSCIQVGEVVMGGSVRRTPYGEWVVVGKSTCNNFTNGRSFGDVVVMKLDSSFNLRWTKLFPMPIETNFGVYTLLVESDGYAIGYDMYKENANNWTNPSIDRNQIIKVDTAGNLLWTWTSPITTHETLISDLVRTSDGGYLYSCAGDGQIHQSGTPGASYRMRGMVQKLSPTRQAQWRYVDTTSSMNGFKRILPLANGDFLVSGATRGRFSNGVYGDYGALYRISSTGQRLWRKRYTVDTARALDQLPYDMAFGKDGDVVLVGVSLARGAYDTLENRQQGWVAKVDSNGCMGVGDPQCGPMSVAEVKAGSVVPSVYPNPTTGRVQISSGLGTVVVQDLSGRVVYRGELKAGTTTLELSGLQSGLYLYRITETGGATLSGKLLKQ